MGATNFPNGVSVSKIKSSIQQRNFVDHVKAIRIDFSEGTSENSTGWKLPAMALVENVMVDVKTVETTGTTKTINFGPLASETGGDANGYGAAVNVAVAGFIQVGPAIVAGGTETYFSANTYGVLLSTFLAGSNVATDVGTYLKKSHLNLNGNTISWTPGSSNFAELVADIIIFYKEII